MALKIATTLKILNIIASIGIGFVAVLRFIHSSLSQFNLTIWAIYYIVFALLILASEFRLAFIPRFFNFLMGRLGKGIFITFCGTLFLDDQFDLECGIGIGVIIIGFINIIARFKDPKGSNPEPQNDPSNNNKPPEPEFVYQPRLEQAPNIV